MEIMSTTHGEKRKGSIFRSYKSMISLIFIVVFAFHAYMLVSIIYCGCDVDNFFYPCRNSQKVQNICIQNWGGGECKAKEKTDK